MSLVCAIVASPESATVVSLSKNLPATSPVNAPPIFGIRVPSAVAIPPSVVSTSSASSARAAPPEVESDTGIVAVDMVSIISSNKVVIEYSSRESPTRVWIDKYVRSILSVMLVSRYVAAGKSTVSPSGYSPILSRCLASAPMTVLFPLSYTLIVSLLSV